MRIKGASSWRMPLAAQVIILLCVPAAALANPAALMWVCVTFVYLVPAVVITTQLLSTPRAHGATPTCPKTRHGH